MAVITAGRLLLAVPEIHRLPHQLFGPSHEAVDLRPVIPAKTPSSAGTALMSAHAAPDPMKSPCN
ncbi:hypothetical protein [Azospirillum sp. SYSU D00513]|uniref:hypothetical protein n=1 Tax=Azospirillum sp. SYSU D00513 TaxID=2812561 RepID=UPI001A961A32|nr:hypothetical protein [Azospirillum sp. SYSU D00513]